MKAWISVVRGYEKKECEDTAIINDTIVNDQDVYRDIDGLFCAGVMDGVGGNAGGKMASWYIAQQLCQCDFHNMEQVEIKRTIEKMNIDLIQNANQISDKQDMATTVTCLISGSDGYYLVHAGNTRLYVMQGAYFKQLSKDQTTFAWLMNRGHYDAAERCNRSEITCCLGGGDPNYAVQLIVQKMFDVNLPNMLMITSDGIHDFVDINDMEDIFAESESDEKAMQLIREKAIQNGSSDDKTILIIRR